MVNNRKIDICHAIALKLRDVAQNFNAAIKIGGLMTTFARFMGFDIKNMPFERVQGRETIDIVMMQAIGIVESTHNGYRLTKLSNEQVPQP